MVLPLPDPPSSPGHGRGEASRPPGPAPRDETPLLPRRVPPGRAQADRTPALPFEAGAGRRRSPMTQGRVTQGGPRRAPCASGA